MQKLIDVKAEPAAEDGGGSEDDDGAGGKPDPKRKKVNVVADEAPRVYGRLRKELPMVKKSVEGAVLKLDQALTNVHLPATSSLEADAELASYLRSALFRRGLAWAWLAETIAEASAALSPANCELGDSDSKPKKFEKGKNQPKQPLDTVPTGRLCLSA